MNIRRTSTLQLIARIAQQMRDPRAAIILLMLTATLTACGKVGAPIPPGPQDQITYPKIYPTH